MARRELKTGAEERRIVNPGSKRLLALAAQRVKLPEGPLWLKYEDDVDTLYIRLKEKTSPTRTDDRDFYDNGVLYDYEDDELVGIEIIDISGQLQHANPT